MGQPARLKKMTLVRGQGCFVQKALTSESFTIYLSNKSNNKNYKDSLKFNKPRFSKAFT